MNRLLLTTILLLGSLLLHAQKAGVNDQNLFELSNTSFIKGDYGAALSGYQKLEQNGNRTAGLYNNIGAIYYKTGRYSLSVLNFEKGIKLSPLDTQLLYNKNKVFAKLNKTISDNNENFDLERERRYNAIDLVNKIATMLFIGCGVLLMITSIAGSGKRWKFISTVGGILIVVSVISIAGALMFYKVQQSKRYAIITRPQSLLHLGPTATSKAGNMFDNGIEVELTNQYKNWYEISDYYHKTGWVYRNDLSEIN